MNCNITIYDEGSMCYMKVANSDLKIEISSVTYQQLKNEQERMDELNTIDDTMRYKSMEEQYCDFYTQDEPYGDVNESYVFDIPQKQ